MILGVLPMGRSNMNENNVSIFETFVEHGVTTQAEATAWESNCLIAMHKAARKILSGYSCAHEEIEDAVQDALRSTLTKIRLGRGEKIENPKDYLVIATANHAINKAKLLKRKKAYISLDAENSFDIASNLLSHSKSAEIKELYKHCLSKLSYKERTLLELLVMGLSRVEIADTLSMKELSVNVSVHRLRQKLSPLKEYLNW